MEILSKENMISELVFIVNTLDEWPHRPLREGDTPCIFKEDASYVVKINNDVIPIYHDDHFYERAKFIGYTKDEFLKAQETIRNAKCT